MGCVNMSRDAIISKKGRYEKKKAGKPKGEAGMQQ